MKRVLIALTTLAIAAGSIGLGADAAAAATMKVKKPIHTKVLVCKTKHWVRLSKDHWIWTCANPKHHHHHHVVVKKTVTKKTTKKK